MVGEGSELRCLASCIYQFFNKYNWLCFLGGGSRGKENPALMPGLECITLVRWGIYLSIALLKCAHFLQPLGMKFQQLILWLQHSKTQEAHQ